MANDQAKSPSQVIGRLNIEREICLALLLTYVDVNRRRIMKSGRSRAWNAKTGHTTLRAVPPFAVSLVASVVCPAM